MSHPNPHHDPENVRVDDSKFAPSQAKAAMARKMKIKSAVKGARSTMHLGKKGAPGITYNELTPKERYYRKSNEARTDRKLSAFHNSGYGRHLSERAKRRGEQD